MEVELRINGMIASQDIAPNESLLMLLRREGCSSVKHGCDTGECGACTVLVDGVPRPSCVMLAAQAAGCSLTTAENLGTSAKLHPIQQAFVETGAVQCGFCTPGMLLSAHALLKKNPIPTDEEVRDALSGNLCRCTGYAKPVQAVLRAAAQLRGETLQPLEHTTVDATVEAGTATGRVNAMRNLSGKFQATLSASAGATTKIPVLTADMLAQPEPQVAKPSSVPNRSLPTINAVKLVTGKPVFAADISPRNMLYARILTSPHAHAVIRNIDVSRAKALSGVHAVLTYKDVPRIPYSSAENIYAEKGIQDQYCLDSIMRYVGDRVAVVAAETLEVAEQALNLISVDYDILSTVLDLRQSLDNVVSRLHPEPESRGIYDAARNIAARVRSDVGDVEQGFAAADLLVEAEYVLPPIQPAPLENHTAVTYFDENHVLVVRTSSQVPHHIRHTLAHLLGIPLRHIRVVKPEVGGGFGIKQELLLEDLCALLTIATQRPVKLEYTRADEFRSSRAYQQHIVRIKTGVKRDGTIVANQLILLADTGAYGTHALITRNVAACALALYPAPHMRFVAEILYTNHAPAGAFPGSGLPQEFFALESHMDEIARQIGLDPLALRRKNWLKAGDEYPLLRDLNTQKEAVARVETCGLSTCLRLVEEKLNWPEKRSYVREGRFYHGVGIALSLHGSPAGLHDVSGAMIKLNEDGSFDIFAGANDSGNGSATLLAQIAAETLNVPIDNVLLHTTDTDTAPFETVVAASSPLYSSGGAVKKASEQIRRQILSVAGRMLNVLPEALKIYDGTIVSPNEQKLTLAQVATHSLYTENRHIMTTASWKTQSPPTTFAAQGVEVEIDIESGSIRVIKAVTAVDAGIAINPMILEGQMQGRVAQALGAGISEELLYDQKGVLLTTNLQNYRIYAASDMPVLETCIVETGDTFAPFGAKSVSEIALYGIAPALANAVNNALGIRLRQLPLNAERILRALHAQAKKS